jgi:CelD/BcsL family acetyltransferase involved in cellulose biosynthesis
LHEARWDARAEDGILRDPQVLAFHRRAAGDLSRAGLLRLDLLLLDGRAIAAHYGLHRHRVGYSYIHGFDPDFARFGPGSLLLAHVIERAAEEGCTHFDFLRGREAYKQTWGCIDQPKWRKRIDK